MKFLNENPYSYNAVSLKKWRESKVTLNETAQSLVAQPLYNFVGKFLGVGDKVDWNKYYQKVQEIVDWAKQKTGSSDINKITDLLTEKANSSPSMNNRKVDDLYIAIQLDKMRKEENGEDND